MTKKLLSLFLFAVILLNVTLVGCAASKNNETAATIPPLPSTTVPGDTPDNANAIDPMQYGAKADGTADDGGAIQQAIDICAQKGGGIVVLKSGMFLSSPLMLKTGVYLKVEAQAILKAIPYTSYPKNILKSKPAPLIGALNASNFGVFGCGTIDGNGQDWWRTQGWQGEDLAKQKIPNQVIRPYLVYFINSSNIIVKDVTLQNSPQFNLVPQVCENVVISNVTIHNPENSPNTDGIDPSGSNIFIDNVKVDTGDDNIAIKGHLCNTHNIYITNSTFYHGHGLSIGSDFEQGVQNVYAQNCTFVNTEAGIRIKSTRGRGGVVSNIHYSDFTMTNVGRAIQITAYYPRIPEAGIDAGQPLTATTPQYTGITINNLTATTVKMAGDIVGVPECPVQDVSLSNVSISGPKGLNVRNAHISTDKTVITAVESKDYVMQENASVDAK